METNHKLVASNPPNHLIALNHFPRLLILAFMMFLSEVTFAQQATTAFSWPKGKRMAVSLTFDDARMSQVDVGTALLDEYGIKATFYVVPAAVEQRIEGWKKATANGHEIGNHSLNHPCTGNFPWARPNALEDYTLEKMRNELVVAHPQLAGNPALAPVGIAANRAATGQLYHPGFIGLIINRRFS